MKRIITFSILILIGAHFASAQQSELVLWYDKPAANWNEALPLGNGRLAAMVFGNPTEERLQLNEETVWAGEPGNNIPTTNFYDALPEIRRLIFEDRHEEAQQLAMKIVPRNAGTTNNYGMPYQPVGDLFLKFPEHQNTTDYKRVLDISRAISTTTYKVDGVTYSREVFTSFTDNIIILKLFADKLKKITCSIGINSLHTKKTIAANSGILNLTGVSGSHANKAGKINFTTYVQPLLDGGKLTTTDSTLNVKDANAVTIFISIATNFKNYHDLTENSATKAKQYLTSATKKKYETLKSSHIAHYQKFFARVSLDLGTASTLDKPTNIRLEEFKHTKDPNLVALYFQFGRYLLISASQPGSQPATLQGKWNDMIAPPWDSKYTININTEMNYWPAEVTNLSELHAPLFSMLKDLELTGKTAAEKLYHARGWVVHHNTDLWRITGPVDGAYYGLWPMGGAWLSQHLWLHYLFTGDKEFLEKHYSILKGAALFYSDILIQEPTHQWLVVAPSMSPENEHHKGVSLSAGTTMDNQLVFDVFTSFVLASKVLGQDVDLRDSIIQKQQQLPPMQIGKFGQLQEWLQDWDNPDDKHRHVSHLYGLYPSNQISLFKTPELFQAARTSLIHRGDHSTGWSMGWKVNLWARLFDGEKAYQLIEEQLTPVHEGEGHGGTYLNLLDAHPPFQIDGNFGCTSGIAEMLVQSHDGVIHLLPALPQQWSSGKVTGLKTRGGFTIDLAWHDRKIVSLKIISTIGGNCRLRTAAPLEDARLSKASAENKNVYFAVAKIKAPLVSAISPVASLSLPFVHEYDLPTEKSKIYSFIFSN